MLSRFRQTLLTQTHNYFIPIADRFAVWYCTTNSLSNTNPPLTLTHVLIGPLDSFTEYILKSNCIGTTEMVGWSKKGSKRKKGKKDRGKEMIKW